MYDLPLHNAKIVQSIDNAKFRGDSYAVAPQKNAMNEIWPLIHGFMSFTTRGVSGGAVSFAYSLKRIPARNTPCSPKPSSAKPNTWLAPASTPTTETCQLT